MPGLQSRQHKDTSCDDDSVCDKNPNKVSSSMQWKVPIDDSNGEKFICQRARKQRAKRNAKRLLNRRKKAALKKERMKNTPFAEHADDPFIPFVETVTIPETLSDEEQFFPTGLHPFRTGTIIQENGFLFKEREIDRLLFYDSLQVLDDLKKTLDIIKERDQYWTTCPGTTPLNSKLADFSSSNSGLIDSGCSGCTTGKTGFIDTTPNTDYLNGLSVFCPTEIEYWNDWLLDGTTR